MQNKAIGAESQREIKQMKKDAIIDLLENDLKEIETLVETFREPERIGSAFLELLRQKHDSLGKEIRLLDYWATDHAASVPTSTLSGAVCDHSQERSVPKKASEPKQAVNNGAKNVPHTSTKPEVKQEETKEYLADETEKMEDPLTLDNEESKAAPQQVAEPNVEEKEEIEEETKEPLTEEEFASIKQTSEKQQDVASAAKKAADIANYGTPVDDLNRAIRISDRFLFMRELFGGNKMAFDAAIETVNMANSFEQAHEYFRQTYGWNETDATVELFMKAVHRRFL